MQVFPLRKNLSHALSLGLSLLALGLSGCNDRSNDYEEPGEKITVKNKYGKLEGRLIFPEEEEKKYPAVIIVPDSGQIDRNGNSPYGNLTNAYIQLSLRLADKGIAALRYDKAGMGPSVSAAPETEEEARFNQGAKDAALFVEALRDDPRISSVTLIGHGDGALLAMLAHAEEKVDALVSLAGTAYSIDVHIREDIEEAISDKKRRDEALTILDKLIEGEMVKKVPASLLGIFRPSVQPYLMSWMKFDPVEEIAKIDVPTLVVHGSTDLEFEVEEAEVLAAGNPDAELEIVKGMNHVLKLDDGETIAKQVNQSYSDPSWKLAPDLVKAIANFVDQ